MSTRVPRYRRQGGAIVGLLALLLVCLAALAGPAGAVEEGGEEIPRPTLEELGCVGPQQELPESCPDPAEPPLFFRWMWGPLLIVGLLAAGMTLFRYLQWQPRFTREREEKLKSRR